MGRHVNSLFLLFLSRLLQFGISLFILIFMAFGLLRFFPGSPWNEEVNLDPQVLANLRDFYGLNQSFKNQFLLYIKRILSGDLGLSMHFVGRSVHSLIWEFGKTSAFLGICAFVLALAGAFVFLFLTRLLRGWKEKGDFLLLILISIPTLALGPICIWIFAIRFEMVPVALLNDHKSYLLPILLLSVKPMLSLARVLTSSVDQVLQENYIQTARALGFSESVILMKWALKNSMTSFLSQVGPLFASLISGSFLIEVLFAIPGLGFQFIDSVLNRDWPLILGLTLVYGAILMTTQLITDLLIIWIDPRAEVL